MRSLFLSLAFATFALFAGHAEAQLGDPGFIATLTASGGSDPCTFCTNETFEAAGYSVAGWTESLGGGIVNEDYTTAPAPFAGAQSLLIKNVAFAQSFVEINLPNTGEGWMQFAVVLTNTAVNGWYIATIADNGGAALASVLVQNGKLQVRHGTKTNTTVTSINFGTTNYITFHYLKGSGANGVADAGFSEHPNKSVPTSGNNFTQTTIGTSTANAQLYRLGGGDVTSGGAVGGAIYDTVRMTTLNPIGDPP